MSGSINLEAIDLAALLCSHVCHDLISPTGAIVNGLEVLDEAEDEETEKFALELIKKSAATASARLQFCRIAFGAAGSSGAQIDLGDSEALARGFLEDGKTKLDWRLPRATVPKNRVKLLLNMLVVAAHAIPRGGVLRVEPSGDGGSMNFRIIATGLNARVPQAVPNLLAGVPSEQLIDAHAVQPYYTGLLARSCGLTVNIATEGDVIVITAR